MKHITTTRASAESFLLISLFVAGLMGVFLVLMRSNRMATAYEDAPSEQVIAPAETENFHLASIN